MRGAGLTMLLAVLGAVVVAQLLVPGAARLIGRFADVPAAEQTSLADHPVVRSPLILRISMTTVMVAFALRVGPAWELPAFWVLTAALVTLSVIDLRIERLPREITYAAVAVTGPLLVLAALVERSPSRIVAMVSGAVIACAVLGIVHMVTRGGLGDGDVRLAPLLGMHLGWVHPALVGVGLFGGFLLGAVVAVVLLVTRRAHRGSSIPFGPFLAAGTVLALLAGEGLVDRLLAR